MPKVSLEEKLDLISKESNSKVSVEEIENIVNDIIKKNPSMSVNEKAAAALKRFAKLTILRTESDEEKSDIEKNLNNAINYLVPKKAN